MKKKKPYYNIKPLLQTGAHYMILYGMRANGKSYQVKETMLIDAYTNASKFVYLRRWKEDIKNYAVEEYFADMPVEKYTNGTYSLITAYQGFIYFANMDEDNKVVRGQCIGRYCALNEAQRYKSQAFVGYKYIAYEEFITDEVYLNEEPKKLQQFISTVARLDKLTVFLIGNTMSRVCPYFMEWNLRGTLSQKAGTIEIYHIHFNDNTVDIAVEHCQNADMGGQMFFGTAAKQIVSGEWDVIDSPRIKGHISDYDLIYEMQVHYQAFTFNLKLLTAGDGNVFLYVYPARNLNTKKRVITDTYSTKYNVSAKLRKNSRAEMLLASCFSQNKICYSDNLTAADFKQVCSQLNFI